MTKADIEKCKTVDSLIKLRRKAVKDDLFVRAAAEKILHTETFRTDIKNNPEKLIECCFSVMTKKQKLVPFKLNDVQKKFCAELNRAKQDYASGKISRVSIIILKSRQQGFTTLITAYQLALILINNNFSGFTAADTVENSEIIFRDKCKAVYDLLPEQLHPSEKYNNRREMYFDRRKSAWSVQVASDQVGRSRTINFFHGSECAFWVNFPKIQGAIGESMTPDCISIYETTANGYNDFKTLWDSKAYINLFYPWWLTREYAIPVKTSAQKEMLSKAELSDNWIGERLRWLKPKTTVAQRHWYLTKYNSYIDKTLIRQEYPCTPDEAFITSGRPVFNTEIITQRLDNLLPPLKQLTFLPTWHNPQTRDKIKSFDIVNGKDVKIYEYPVKNIPYVIGGDTAGDGSDKYTASVHRNDTGKQVATVHMDIGSDSSPYTDILYCLGMYYNVALIGIEVNFNLQPIIELQRLRYPHQYVRQRFDNYTKPTEKKYGWKTDGNTRPILYTLFAQLINENCELLTDRLTLEEARAWEYNDKGRPNHRIGGHDDQLFAAMIANKIRDQQSRTFATPTKTVKVPKDIYQDYVKATAEQKAIIIKRYGGIPTWT